jgi:hypothetical protein
MQQTAGSWEQGPNASSLNIDGTETQQRQPLGHRPSQPCIRVHTPRPKPCAPQPRARPPFRYLAVLSLRNNRLSGELPSDWDAQRLELLLLSDNQLSGELRPPGARAHCPWFHP